MSEPWRCVFSLRCNAADHRAEFDHAKRVGVDKGNIAMLNLAAQLRHSQRIARTSFMFMSGSFVADGKYVPFGYVEASEDMPVEEDRPRLRHIMLTDYVEQDVLRWFIEWINRTGVFHGREVVSAEYSLGIMGGNFYEIVDGVAKLSDGSLVAFAYVDIRTSVHRGYSKVESYFRAGFDYVYLIHPYTGDRIHKEVAARLVEEFPEAGYMVPVPDDYVVYVYRIARRSMYAANFTIRRLVEAKLSV